MRVEELCRPHLVELKQQYLTQLDDSGELKEIAGLDSLSMGALADADEIISDGLVLEHFASVEFTKDDFTTDDVDDLFPEINIDIKEVECDDMGDPYWKFYAVFYSKDDEIWSDYFHSRPDDVQLHNSLQEAYNDGDLYPKGVKA